MSDFDEKLCELNARIAEAKWWWERCPSSWSTELRLRVGVLKKERDELMGKPRP